MAPENNLPIYQRVARAWALRRDSLKLVEKRWLDRFLRVAPGKRVLDLGRGLGVPVPAYLHRRGAEITKVDCSEEIIASFRESFPNATAVNADLRGLVLQKRFDAILAWDSFFHLSQEDQRGMIPVFAAHSAPGAALMFTSGNRDIDTVDTVEGIEVRHSSLCPDEYEFLLADNGFEILYFRPEDPDCGGQSLWLSRFTGGSPG